jgi:hypothetical protein
MLLERYQAIETHHGKLKATHTIDANKCEPQL